VTQKRTSPALAVAVAVALLALVLPAAAPARIIEIGNTEGAELPAPSCPANPCQAVTRTTAYQAKVGPNRGLMAAPEHGRVVAFTVRLGDVTGRQNRYFSQRLGGAPSLAVSVLRPQGRLFHTVVATSPVRDVSRYLGRTSQFALTQSLRARRGDVIGLTVPTWAPLLQIGLGSDTSWRGSRRPPPGCNTQEAYSAQTAQQVVGARAQYRCLYQTARLSYSATLVTDAEVNPRERERERADDDEDAERRR
jgi:hypothetical protein